MHFHYKLGLDSVVKTFFKYFLNFFFEYFLSKIFFTYPANRAQQMFVQGAMWMFSQYFVE